MTAAEAAKLLENAPTYGWSVEMKTALVMAYTALIQSDSPSPYMEDDRYQDIEDIDIGGEG